MSEKRRRVVGILIIACGVVALVIAIWSAVNRNNDSAAVVEDDDVLSIDYEAYVNDRMAEEDEKADASGYVVDYDESVADGEQVVADVDGDEDDQTLDSDFIINSDFQLNGMDYSIVAKELTEDMLISLQEQLYAGGYYNYTKADVWEVVEDEQCITVSMYVYANRNMDIDMVYYKNEKAWVLKFWEIW